MTWKAWSSSSPSPFIEVLVSFDPPSQHDWHVRLWLLVGGQAEWQARQNTRNLARALLQTTEPAWLAMIDLQHTLWHMEHKP
jgi:hypothetical protein